MKKNCLFILILLGITLLGLSYKSNAMNIDVSTSNGLWIASFSSYSGIAYHPFIGRTPPDYDSISISSTGNQNGTFVGGGSASAFTGTWYAKYSFYLPSWATNIVFQYEERGADDRAYIYLNNNYIDWFYGNTVNSGQITNQSYFNLGSQNILTLEVINNPYNPQSGSPMTFVAYWDYVSVAMRGTVSYVPIPSTIILLISGLAGIFTLRKIF